MRPMFRAKVSNLAGRVFAVPKQPQLKFKPRNKLIAIATEKTLRRLALAMAASRGNIPVRSRTARAASIRGTARAMIVTTGSGRRRYEDSASRNRLRARNLETEEITKILPRNSRPTNANMEVGDMPSSTSAGLSTSKCDRQPHIRSGSNLGSSNGNCHHPSCGTDYVSRSRSYPP